MGNIVPDIGWLLYD